MKYSYNLELSALNELMKIYS